MLRGAATAAACLLMALAGPAAAESHHVTSGQTLWEIARHYGCSIDQLKRANRLRDDTILAGQRLEVPRCGQAHAAVAEQRALEQAPARRAHAERTVHVVASGDTLSAIASQYDSTIDELRALNGIEGSMLHPGQQILVRPGPDGLGLPVIGQSIGLPHAGRIDGAVLLPHDPGYYRRDVDAAWGANHTVHGIRRAVAAVRARFPRVHRLAIGDLSTRRGGPISGHRSHQSGRDADIGLYFRRRPATYPREFVPARRDTLDFAATWALLEAFADTHDEDGGVLVMFLNYDVQRMIYQWGRKNGVPRRDLDRILQYPAGRYARKGLVRHERGHYAHVHVRFKCPKNDRDCD